MLRSECLLIEEISCSWRVKLLQMIGFLRDSDKMIFERLQKEFEAARAAQTQGSFQDNLWEFIVDNHGV